MCGPFLTPFKEELLCYLFIVRHTLPRFNDALLFAVSCRLLEVDNTQPLSGKKSLQPFGDLSVGKQQRAIRQEES